MSEKKNIDKLFKEQLKDFERAPNDAVWEHIERELQKDKRERKIIPFWWKVAGVAAVLALLFTVGKTIFNDTYPSTLENEVVDSEISNDTLSNANEHKTNSADFNASKELNHTPVVNQQNSETKEEEEEVSPKNSENNITTSKDKNLKTVVVSNKDKATHSATSDQTTIKNKAHKTDAVAHHNTSKTKAKDETSTTTSPNNTTTQTAVAVKDNATQNQKDTSKTNELFNDLESLKTTKVTSLENSEKEQATTIIDSSQTKAILNEENAIENAITDAEKDKDSSMANTVPLKRWSVAPNIAPVYFNTLGKGSPIDDQFVDNTKEGEINMSYGIRGSYALNKKLRIRAGVNRVDLGYSTNNVLVFDGASRNADENPNIQLGHVKFNDSISNNTSYVSANTISFATGPEILFTKEQGSINQQLGFIEVPIEIEYSVLNTAFEVNLIGGFSTLFLSNNEVYVVQENGNKTLIGEATNINNMSYSANFGIGLNYNFTEQFRFNLEPTFKYQMNTFNDVSGDFKPFFIGVYTGLSFKF